MLHRTGKPHKYRPESGVAGAANYEFGFMEELVMRTALLIVGAVAVTACNVGTDSSGGASDFRPVTTDQALLEQWKVELIEADEAFEQSVQTVGLGGWLAAFGTEGMMISGGRSYFGPEGIRQVVLPMFADPEFELTWDPTFASVGPSGDLGYTIGTYELTSSSAVGPVTSAGSYLTVWRRQANGDWKVEADIGSPGDP